MLLTVFEKYIFLQSLGWGIANSLWQAALLFIIYQFIIVTGRRLSALAKYQFGLLMLFASFGWFVSTIVQNYFVIKNSGTQAEAFGWLDVSEKFSQSLQWLSVAYFLVLGVHLLSFAKKLTSLFSISKNDFLKAPVDIRIFTEQTAFHLGIQKKVSIWLSEKAGVPSVIGFFKPVILFPVTALNNLTTAQAEAVILHELAHIRRNDYIINFVQSCIEMILFFNPFVKMLGSAVRKERENCCDDWVLNYRYNKHDYASALLILEQNRFATIQFALAATNGKKKLLHRVKRLFADEPSVNTSLSQRIKLMAVTFAILIPVLFALPIASKKINSGNERVQAIAVPVLPLKNIAVNTSLPLAIIIEDKRPAPKATAKNRVKEAAVTTAIDETPEEIEYNTALINEDLLKQKEDRQLQDMTIHAASIETENNNKLIVKVEEEQSGVKDKCTYYVEVNNNNGVPDVKPLVVLNKKIGETSAKNKTKVSSTKQKQTRKKTTT